MPNQSDLSSYSHCVVMWEEKTNDQTYAVVDVKRAKTVSTLKIGITIVFEGYQRERRRGKILFLGSKKDCFTFGFDVAEDEQQVNIYSWSGPPGLREQTDEVAQAIRNGGICSSTFQRTASSSSTTSITSINKSKGKKLVERNTNIIDHSITTIDKPMPAPPLPPLSSSTASSITVVNSVTTSNSDDRSTNSNNSSSTNIDKGAAKTPIDDASVLEENKALREKNQALEEQLLYEKENSIPLPSEEVYQFFKAFCMLYERIKKERNVKAIEVGKLLPCSEVQLKLAKKSNAACTINNLIKYCFKDLDLKKYSFLKLKSMNETLLANIYEYVCNIHAPQKITQGQFSNTISLKCRHLRENKKSKPEVSKPTKNKPTNKQKGSKQTIPIEKENIPDVLHAQVVEEMDQEEENDDSNDTF